MNKKRKVRFTNKNKSQFSAILKERVEEYFTKNNISQQANASMIIKSVVLLSCYILPFIALIVFQPSMGVSMVLWVLMALGMAGVGMSVMHDANHGAYSSNNTVNYIMGHLVNLLGASAFNWKIQHNILHHTYTNVTHLDEDINDKLILKFSPHTPVKKWHRFQWTYALPFYGIITLYWVFLKDFVQFNRYVRTGQIVNNKKQNRITFAKIIAVKVFYLFIFLGIPVLFTSIPFAQIVLGFLVMHFIAGIILSVTFQLAHTVEGASHPLPNDNGVIENDWSIHQMNTTVNFCRSNKFISWYLGGLNFQIEHHLFPRISHIHYPAIAPIVKQTAEEFNIPYLENTTLAKALRSHIVTLQSLGKLPDMEEAIV